MYGGLYFWQILPFISKNVKRQFRSYYATLIIRSHRCRSIRVGSSEWPWNAGREGLIFFWQIYVITLECHSVPSPPQKKNGGPTCVDTMWETATKFCMKIKLHVMEKINTLAKNADARSNRGIAGLVESCIWAVFTMRRYASARH